MLHVNDDTNDELFRRAADDYFLKANGPDWPSVADKMIGAAGPAGSENKEGRRLPFLYLALKKIGNAVLQPCKWIFNAGNELKKAKKKADGNTCHWGVGCYHLFNPLNRTAAF